MDEAETLLSPSKDLYALLHVSPDASEEDIKRAYRQWAQVYHPDKYQSPHMKEIATQNFQRICEAYEILCDENKRQIYDIYGMEGLTSGLELGPNLNKVQEIKEELERLRRLREQEKFAQVRPRGSILANMSLPHFLRGRGIMQGMAMASEVQSQISKRSTIAFGGNLAISERAGGGAASAVLRHQISPVSSVEFVASAGLGSLIGFQTSRDISAHSTATMGLAVSLVDGSVNLSNAWTRQLSETSNGNIQLALGSESSIKVGWKKKQEKYAAAGEIKFGPGALGAHAYCTHHFSSKSHGRISGKIAGDALELEIGGGRKVSNLSTLRMMYLIGIQGVFWKLELHRGGQKLVIPILLTRHLSPLFASGAFFIPASLYFLVKKFVLKPYYLKREKQKKLETMERTSTQVKEARIAAEKAQELLQNVANRKRNKASEIGGLVIMKAVYGSRKALKKLEAEESLLDDLSSEVFDVTTPLNFLVNDSTQLKLHGGVKKSGIMGFHDPCPGEPKQLLVEYTYKGQHHRVMVDDEDELLLPLEAHRL